MDFVFHWERSTNFVNNEGGKSAKNRVGHKSSSLSQRVVISVNRSKLDTTFKKMLTNEITRNRHLIRKDGRASIFIKGEKYILNCRDEYKMANNVVNLMLMDRFNNNVQIDKQTIN